VFFLHPAYFSIAVSDVSRPFFQSKIAKSAIPLNLTPFTILLNSTGLLLFYQVFLYLKLFTSSRRFSWNRTLE